MEEITAEAINVALGETINTKFTSIATPQKYVSMFRIDGVPILPPLMTHEKRRHMQKLKEKAVKVEQRLAESRRRRQKYNLEYGTVVEEFTQDPAAMEYSNESSSSCCMSENNIGQDDQREDVEKSYMLLSDILIQNESESISIMPNHNFGQINRATAGEARNFDEICETYSSKTNLMQRMQKLQKSETLIYDHRSNTLLSPLSENEVQVFQQQQQQINLDQPGEKPIGSKIDPREVEESANLNYLTEIKSKTTYADKGLKKIPSICIDPPTPITSSRCFTDGVNPQNSIDSINVNNRENPNKDVNESLINTISSDESFNCMESATNLDKDLKTHRKVTNITSKILKFENFSLSETKDDTSKSSNVRPPQRSATSPSLKELDLDRSQTLNVSVDVRRDSQTENALVRSNSFTLDGPSKALIEHIRQKKATPSDNYPTKRSNISMSAMRDTVESKAKRVQKVELKSRSMSTRVQLKPSTTNITSPPSSLLANSKMKRSHYEQKFIKPKISRQLKKSASGTTALKQIKPRPSMPSFQLVKTPTDSAPSSNLHFNGIETEHRQKFLELLAHQKREQQRMQQVFEEQQKYLLEQLTAKVSNVRISNKNSGGTGHGSLGNSTIVRTDYVESMALQSPTVTANSSIVSNSLDLMSGGSDLPSLDLSACSSTIPTTAQSSNRCTPRRRLFPHDLSPSPSMCSDNGGNVHNIGRSNGTTRGSSSSRRKMHHSDSFEETKRRAAAVTKINAYVRGYLVRRLFQTEQIQRIVQTIKDTLIFVLSLHMEIIHNPIEAKIPANIKLKTRLLNQLTSATRALHLVLFQTSIKERMEIINRDRIRIKTKILTMTMKSSPRFQI